jgi:DHA2 family multidrug resistance protein-like MFS transporter
MARRRLFQAQDQMADSSVATRSPEEADGIPMPARIFALLPLGLGITLAVLDSAIANVALPVIARQFHETAAESIWVVSAYQLAVTVVLLPFASLGDLIGYRRVYLVGLVVFTLSSLGCAMSDSLLQLTLARVLQGLGAAGVMSVNIALLRMIFPRAKLGRGVSLNATVVALGSALGPTIASAVLSLASWRWLFAINVPLGVLAVAVGLRFLPKSKRQSGNFDFYSALLNVLTFGALLLGFNSYAHAEPAIGTEIELALALVFGVIFVRRELHRPRPLLPLDLLARPLFALSIATSFFSFTAQMLAFVCLPFYLQQTLGRTQVETGLLMTPWPAVIVFVAPLSGVLSDKYSPGILGAIGLLLLSAGLAALALLPHDPGALSIMWRTALCGAGFGLFQSPNNRTILSSAPPERSGGASGMLGTARLLGQTFGAALVALIFNLSDNHGTVAAMAIASAFALVAACLSALRMSSRVSLPAPVALRSP